MATPKEKADAVAAVSTVSKSVDTMSDDDGKPAARPVTARKSRRQAKAKRRTPSADEMEITTVAPSLDPPRAKFPKPLELEEDNDAGYDTDGWDGPPRGTLEEELEEVNEIDLPVMMSGEEEDVPANNGAPAQQDEDQAGDATPVHVPIPEEDLLKLTVPELKLELQARKVPLKGLHRKEKFLMHLREALSPRSSRYTPRQHLLCQPKRRK